MNHFTRQGSRIFTGTATVLALSAALASAPARAGDVSSFTESRGYHTCVEAAGRAENLVKVDSRYFIYEHADARRFYLNGYAFRDGDSVPVKIACDTTLGGHRLLDLSVDGGSYAGRTVEPVRVADSH